MSIFQFLSTYWIPISLIIVIVSTAWFAFHWRSSLRFALLGLAAGFTYIGILYLLLFKQMPNFLIWIPYLLYCLGVLVPFLVLLPLSLVLKIPWLKNLAMVLLFATLSSGITSICFLMLFHDHSM